MHSDHALLIAYNYLMIKKKIAILMGGPSSEHEISVKSGLNVIKHLDSKKYTVLPVFIDKRGFWLFNGKKEQPLSEPEALLGLQRRGVSATLVALHGEYGEDGGVQYALKSAGVPFTGSLSLPSALAMHKILAGSAFARAGLNVPESLEVVKCDWRKRPQEVLKNIYNHFGARVVVKPTNRGSSVGVSIVNILKGDLGPLETAIEYAFSASRHVIAQRYVYGREVTCGVLDVRGNVEALLPTEILPVGRKFFDYAAKYEGASREITPPQNMSLALIKKIEAAALTAHKALGLKGVTRTDMIVAPGGRLYILEINAIPGLTETSLISHQAKACGISFTKLLDLMVEDALHEPPTTRI